LRRIGWNGVAMLEYRRGPAPGGFRPPGINARFWGAPPPAPAPRGGFPPPPPPPGVGGAGPGPSARPRGGCRQTIPGEVRHVWSVLRDGAVPRRDKLRAVARFAGLGLDPRIHSDLWWPGDRGLALREALRWARETGVTLAQRARPRVKQSL